MIEIETPIHRKLSTIVSEALGEPSQSISKVPNQGHINETFFVDTKNQSLVLRVGTSDWHRDAFFREKKTVDLIRAEREYTPEIISIGQAQGLHFSIQERVAGVVGTEYQGDTAAIWRQLGQYSKHFHAIEVTGHLYEMFAPSESETSWTQEYLDDMEASKQALITEYQVMNEEQFSQVQSTINMIASLEFQPCINHANIGLSNVIVDADDTAHIIDWGTVQGHLAPHREIAELMTMNCTPEFLREYMIGHELDPSFLEDEKHILQSIQAIRLTTNSMWICAEKPDLVGLLSEHSTDLAVLLDSLYPA